jgi:hypothetical protein
MLNHFGPKLVACSCLVATLGAQCGPPKRSSETSRACREYAAELNEVASLMRYMRKQNRRIGPNFDSRKPPRWLIDIAYGKREAIGYQHLERLELRRALASNYPIVYSKSKVFHGVLVDDYAGPGYYMLGAPQTCLPLGILDDGGLIPRPARTPVTQPGH